MPRQLTKRGHRLVFSNGIVGLAIASTLLVVVFHADVHRLIPLYAIGVFTSFTLSQAGMAKRHLRLREPGWRHGLAINAAGALTTGIVTVVVAITKFSHGAWAGMVFVPVMVLLLVRMNHQYDRERRDLERDSHPSSVARPPGPPPSSSSGSRCRDRPRSPVREDDPTVVGHAIHVGRREDGEALGDRWSDLGIDIPLEHLTNGRDRSSAIAEHVARMSGEGDVNVIVPRPAVEGPFDRLRTNRAGASLAKALLPIPGARVTVIRDHAGPGHLTGTHPDGAHFLRISPRPRHRVIVPVDRLDRALLRAIRYALSLDATEVRAVHAAVDQDGQERLIRRWMELGVPIELDVIECWDRNVARSLEGYVVEHMRGRAEITIVLPRRDVDQIRYRWLHDRTSRAIGKALGRYEHVDISVVPYRMGRQPYQHGKLTHR
jgi:hypothetical protein